MEQGWEKAEDLIQQAHRQGPGNARGKATGCLGAGCAGRTTSCPANNPHCEHNAERTFTRISGILADFRTHRKEV
jgi:hypothetical protein